MSDHSDSYLDAKLRKAEMPDDLRQRLRRIAIDPSELWSDAQIDEALSDINLPNEFSRGLQEIPWSDLVENELVGLPVPSGLLARQRVIALERPRSAWAKLLTVACLFFVLATTQLGAMFMLANGFRSRPESQTQFVYVGPPQFEFSVLEGEPNSNIVASNFVPEVYEPELETIPVSLIDFDQQETLGPAERLAAMYEGGMRPETDLLIERFGILTSPTFSADTLPEMEVIALPRPRGMQPPLTGAYNRRFLLQHWTHPITSPSADKQLATTEVPLTTSTESFDRVEKLAKDSQLSKPRKVRVEDFVAAMSTWAPDDRKPSDKNHLHLTVAGGPAIFQQQGVQTLQVGVRAHDNTRKDRGVHFTVVLDRSANMQGGKLSAAQRALTKWLPRLSSKDRVTLLIAGESVTVPLETLTREDHVTWETTLHEMKASGGIDLGASIQQAVMNACDNLSDGIVDSTNDSHLDRRVIFITSGRTLVAPSLRERLIGVVAAAHEAGVELNMIDLTASQTGATTSYGEVCQAGGGSLYRSSGGDAEIVRSLMEVTTKSPTLAAVYLKASITFDPARVEGYRILGHEAVSLGGLVEHDPIELHAGESATTLIEIWPTNVGTSADSSKYPWGELEVTWRDPLTAELHTAKRKLSKRDCAPNFASAEPEFQKAVLAAHAAEVLRDSPFAEDTLRPLRTKIQEADSKLGGDRQLQRLSALLDELIRLRRDR